MEINFNEKCYRLIQLIPKGKVTTYREIAKALNTRSWRAVGNAMAKNQNLLIVPCHRVVRSDGKIGQYALGSEKKAELLSSEGIKIYKDKIQDLDKFMYRFNLTTEDYVN